MLFFCFDNIAEIINEENEFKKKHVQKEFIKNWKNFAHNSITKSDLKIINDILNSPKNIFYSALQNKNEVTESTEIYQEKYNNMLNKIEKFFLEALKTQKTIDTSEEDDDNDYV
jgi:aryl-phospho-beta-D-glucosidase BglC (GH1 family)